MTNKQLAAEVCRVIRGFAMTYPEGLEIVAREVDALRVPAPEDVGWLGDRTTDATAAIQHAIDRAAAVGRSLRQENATHTSEQDSAAPKTQVPGNAGGERRKRGRPRKVQG